MEGIVDRYSEQKGFGFIVTQDNGKEVAFHRSAIMMNGYKTLSGGDRVRFEVDETIRGLEAKHIEKVG